MIRPRMNEPVSLGKRGSWTTDRSGFRCDLLWPDQGVAVEYDSTLCHTGAARIARDAARRNALESLGLTVVTATWRQVANVREYNRFARILAGHLGTRIRRCYYRSANRLSGEAAKPSLTLPPSPLGLPRDVPGSDTSRSFGFTALHRPRWGLAQQQQPRQENYANAAENGGCSSFRACF